MAETRDNRRALIHEPTDNMGHVGVGVSTFVIVRNQSAAFGDFEQALTTDGQALVSVADSEYSYQHWRLVFKLGIAGELDNWSFGRRRMSAPLRSAFRMGRTSGSRGSP